MTNINPTKIKTFLTDSINFILENKAKYLVNGEKSFSRNRKISFSDTMLFPIVVSGESTSVEMLDYFPQSDVPTQAAMIYRRDHVKVEAFKDLLTTFTSKLSAKNTFHGMSLIACDGSRINTPYNPADSNSFVKCIKGRKGFNQYHLTTLYDVINDYYVDAVIQGYFSMNEKAAFCEMIDRFPKDKPVIFTADRGFSSFNVLAHLIKNQQYFVIRLNSKMAQNLFSENKTDANEFDIQDVVHIGKSRIKKCRELRNYHCLTKSKTYDFIPAGSKNVDSLQLRLVKFELSEGNFEYLVTNLSKSEFSLSDLKEIYRLRWGIETSYRYLKYADGLIHIHSLKPNLIFQEIYAKLICYNFCAAVEKGITAPKNKGNKHEYKIDKTYLTKVCIRFLKNKHEDIIELIAKRKAPVRAGRKFKRTLRRQHADALQYR